MAFAEHQRNAPYLRWKSTEFQRDVVDEFTPVFDGTPLAVLRRPDTSLAPAGS